MEALRLPLPTPTCRRWAPPRATSHIPAQNPNPKPGAPRSRAEEAQPLARESPTAEQKGSGNGGGGSSSSAGQGGQQQQLRLSAQQLRLAETIVTRRLVASVVAAGAVRLFAGGEAASAVQGRLMHSSVSVQNPPWRPGKVSDQSQPATASRLMTWHLGIGWDFSGNTFRAVVTHGAQLGPSMKTHISCGQSGAISISKLAS